LSICKNLVEIKGGTLEENDYDLILLDIQMPEVDRLTATIKIRG
jgi:CheY-like chemotaxis protein